MLAPDEGGDADAMKWVYEFSEGSREQRELLGGKGANVAEMTRVLGADRVPAGFTITTEACVAYMEAGREPPEGLADQVDEALAALERSAGKRLGPDDPLLVSVRSGARVSMPGMLDTVLNLGLNDESAAGLARSTDDERFAWDAYRRCRCSATSSRASRARPSSPSSRRRGRGPGRGGHRARRRDPAGADRELSANVRGAHRRAVPERAPAPARAGDHGGLRLLGRRARGRLPPHQRHPRRLGHGRQRAADGVRQSWPDLRLGVAFSRDERTGAPTPSGDFLANAQGEDVVAGTRNPEDLDALAERLPEAHAQLLADLATLEALTETCRTSSSRSRRRSPVPAADPRGQAPRPGRGPVRARRRGRGPADP